jgi:hypothetical protein
MKEEYEKHFDTAEWVATKPAVFDYQKEYDEKIFPKLKEIEEICQELGLPFHTRFFFAQSEDGNSSATVSFLAGPERATPELLGLTMMDQLDHDTPMNIAGLMMAACQKFGGDDSSPMGIFMP